MALSIIGSGFGRTGTMSLKLALHPDDPDNPEDVDDVLSHGRRIIKGLRSLANRGLIRAVDKLLPLKNESWLRENEEPLTAAQLLLRVKLESIVVYSGGNAELYYNDDGLFEGHTILVQVEPDSTITNVEIAG